MKFYIILFLASFSIFGCKEKITNPNISAFFGGEIINPKNNHVIISRSGLEIDTLFLDKENRFLKKINNLTSGLYTFKHGSEYQLVLLEPNDSILVRLNTVDFDESLVFTGNGSKKNNLLIQLFLENEIDNKKLTDNFKYEPEEFINSLDSSRLARINDLNLFLEHKPQSDLFRSIAKATINYHYYAIKEIYPFGYFGNNNLIHFDDLPEGFYNFRKDVNYNQKELREIFAYNSFLFRHFNNLALEKYYDQNDHTVPFDRSSIAFNLGKLHLVDSIVDNHEIKNYLLKYTARDFIFNTEDKEKIDEVLNSFVSKCTNDEYKKSVTDLAINLEKTNPGHEFPDIDVIDFKENTLALKTIILKPSVVYFWSSSYKMHNINTHYQINILKTKYPNINFIAINIDDDDKKYWKSAIKHLKAQPDSEFRFKNPEQAILTLAINSVNKVYIIDGKKNILSSNLNMFNDDFDALLKRL